MPVARVVRDPVDQDAQPALVRGGQQLVEVRERPEQRIDVAVILDVVSVVTHRRAIERRQPDSIDPEPYQVIEMLPDAAQIADAVTADVAEAPRIDLVHDGRFPPGLTLGHGRTFHGAFRRVQQGGEEPGRRRWGWLETLNRRRSAVSRAEAQCPISGIMLTRMAIMLLLTPTLGVGYVLASRGRRWNGPQRRSTDGFPDATDQSQTGQPTGW
jgi:hypothetical protein